MARGTGGAQAGEDVVHVALRALHADVRSRQWESRLRVIKHGAGPGARGMANRTVRRESGGGMVRIIRGVVIRHVARRTRGIGQVVIVVGVALRASQRRVRSGERESGGRVIECRRLPCRSGMAGLASLGESAGNVIRIARRIEVVHVTRRASRAQSREYVVHVTLRTLHIHVRSRQRERRVVVIESRPCPRGRRVAGGAISRETSSLVIRVRSAVVIGHVATGTNWTGQAVVAIRVTLRALQGCVRARQCEAGIRVIECRLRPRSRVVASFASLRETGGHVIWIRRSLEILHMARRAGGAQAGEDVVDVAICARRVDVRSR